MASKNISSRTRPAKIDSGRVIKSSKSPAVSKRVVKKKDSSTLKSAAGKAPDSSAWIARSKKLAEIFGPEFPKGKYLLPDGNLATAVSAQAIPVCVVQYAPRPDRMSWVYVTNGLSQTNQGSAKSAGTELVLLWRQCDTTLTSRILCHVSNYILESGNAVSVNQIVTGQDVPKLGATGFQHWLACKPDANIPDHIEHSKSKTNLLILVGITDAEMQVALKVNPALADGKRVLLEALRVGGVFPVTDPARVCLTRRRDFNRLWESAFRLVKEKHV